MLQDILKEFSEKYDWIEDDPEIRCIISELKDFIAHTYNTARKEQLAEVKDNLFKGFKAPKGNQFYSNGWKQCRNQVLDIIYLLNKKI